MSGWLEDEIRLGISGLYTLMLDRMPPAAELEFTVRVWVEAVTFEQAWDRERDTLRVRGAFTRLTRDSLRWPSPQEFLRALPAVLQKRLPRKVAPREPSPVALSEMATCRRLLDEALEDEAALAKPLRDAVAPRVSTGPGPYDRPAYDAFDDSVAELAAQPEDLS